MYAHVSDVFGWCVCVGVVTALESRGLGVAAPEEGGGCVDTV